MAEVREKLWNANYVKLNFSNFMLFFSFYLIVPLLPVYMSETFHSNKDVIGMVLSGFTVTALLIRPFSGYIVDSYSRKKVLLICYFLFFLFFAGYLTATTLLAFAIVRTLHGAPFGASTVSNSTVAIDSLPSSRRTEGIGYYGLSNNVAMALGPSAGMWIYQFTNNFSLLFWASLIAAGIGFALNCTVQTKFRVKPEKTKKLSADRFFLFKGWLLGIVMVTMSFAFGIVTTYLAIYGKEELGITTGTSGFFVLLAVGLIMSRLIGSRTLRKGMVVFNCSVGVTLSLCGYLLFASNQSLFGYYGAALIIGLGNGHMFPAMQSMFLNLADNSKRGTANATLLTSWDVGIGLGIVLGGVVSEHFGYIAAFYLAFAVNALGVATFFLSGRQYYLRNKVR